MEGDKGSATPARLLYEQAEQLSSPPGLKVDYGWLVDRTVKQQYEDLRQLFARLKSGNIPEQDRSRHVIHYATHARAALIKLLVMLKWKQVDVDKVLPDGGKVGKLSLATGLDEWQDSQNEHNRQVRLLLDFFAEHLKTFQLQTPDVNTALDLLVNGDFKSGPQYLDSTYVPPKPLTAQGRSDTLQEMNELIAYRLQVEEDLPSRLQVVAIRDGKLYLRADSLFECAVTLGIVDPRKQWVMSDLRFLYVAKQDLKGKNAHPAEIPHELKLHLCEMIDTQVLGSLYEGRIAMEASLGQDELLPRCKTFHKLFGVLQLLSLSHQLETLFQQAKELEASEWAGNLRVKMSPDRKSFAMTYWSKPTLQSTNLSGRSSQSHGPLHGGEIVIRIARIASQDDDVLYGAAPDVQPAVFALEVDWHPEAGWLGVNPGTKPVVDEDVFGVDPDDLDVEAILLDIVTFHAEQVTNGLKTFMDERLVSAGMFQADDVSVVVTELGSNVLLRIYDERWLKLQINTVTGQLHIGEADATMASSVELRLATSSRLANIHTDKLLDVLVNTRTMLARDALEEKLRCLELHPYRDLGVSTQELDAHNLASTGPGQPMKPVLHAPLPADPSKSVLLALHANSLTLAIVHFALNKNTNGVSIAGAPGTERRTIADMEWLNVADLPLAQQVGPRCRAKTIMIYDRLSRSQLRALSFELSLDDLQRIFAFCNAIVTTRLVAAQFTGRGMPPIPDAEAVPLKMLASGLGLPRGTKRKLAISARYMFPDRDVQGMISDVIDISIERGHGGTVRPSKITARLALQPKAVRVAITSDQAPTPKTHEATGNPGWTVRLDTRPATASVSVETNTSRDYVEGLFDEFARVGMLLRLLAEANRATETSGATVDSAGLKILRYDLAGVWLEYRQGQSILLATPRHVQQQVYTIERLDINLNDSLRGTVVDLLQTVLEEQLADGLGLGGFFQYAKLVSPCLEALLQAGEAIPAELVVCTKRRWVLLWRRGDTRHGVAISFIMPGEFKEWSGGYLVSDAFSKEGVGLGHDVGPTPVWQEVLRRCNRADDRGDEGKYGIELDQGRDLAIEVGTGEVVVFGRLLKEMESD